MTDKQISLSDRHYWKHYFSETSLAGSNNCIHTWWNCWNWVSWYEIVRPNEAICTYTSFTRNQFRYGPSKNCLIRKLQSTYALVYGRVALQRTASEQEAQKGCRAKHDYSLPYIEHQIYPMHFRGGKNKFSEHRISSRLSIVRPSPCHLMSLLFQCNKLSSDNAASQSTFISRSCENVVDWPKRQFYPEIDDADHKCALWTFEL